MKKRILKIIFIVVITLISAVKVKAMGYDFKELIPKDKIITIRGDYFLYKDVKLNNDKINIASIKNISKENHAITLSIAFFDNNKDNIGIINYCSTTDALNPQREVFNYNIKIDSEKLADNKTISDIKYISILSENSTCRLGGSKEFIGKKVEDINVIENDSITDSTKLLINILKVIAICLFILFIYKYLFTSAYQNIDGNDTRKFYKYKTKNNKKKNKTSNKSKHVQKNTKSKEIIEQELHENNEENKDNSDLHKLYK